MCSVKMSDRSTKMGPPPTADVHPRDENGDPQRADEHPRSKDEAFQSENDDPPR